MFPFNFVFVPFQGFRIFDLPKKRDRINFQTKEDSIAKKLGLFGDEGLAPPTVFWETDKCWGGLHTFYLEHDKCGARARIGRDKKGQQYCFCPQCEVIIGEYEDPGCWCGYALPLKKSKVDPF